MVKWPKDETTVMFNKIADPIKEAIEFAYDLTRQNKRKSIPWHGLDIGEAEKVSNLTPKERLKKTQLDHSLEDQGRDALDEIIGIAVQLGIEQGRRIEKQSIENHSLKTKLEIIKSLLN